MFYSAVKSEEIGGWRPTYWKDFTSPFGFMPQILQENKGMGSLHNSDRCTLLVRCCLEGHYTSPISSEWGFYAMKMMFIHSLQYSSDGSEIYGLLPT